MKGSVERHDISITLLDDIGKPRITWNLFECWPTPVDRPEPERHQRTRSRSSSSSLAYERIEVDQWK